MHVFVSEVEWRRLSPRAREAVVNTLREHRLLPDGKELQVSPLLPPLEDLGEERSLRDPAVAQAVRAAAPEGREAVAITVFTWLSTRQDDEGRHEGREVCFVVTYAPPGKPPATRAREAHLVPLPASHPVPPSGPCSCSSPSPSPADQATKPATKSTQPGT